MARRKNSRDSKAIQTVGPWMYESDTTVYTTYYDKKTLNLLKQNTPFKAVIGEYADYANFSDMAVNEALDETVADVAKEMAYKMANEADELIEIGGSTNWALNPLPPGEVLTVAKMKAAVKQLEEVSIKPKDGMITLPAASGKTIIFYQYVPLVSPELQPIAQKILDKPPSILL